MAPKKPTPARDDHLLPTRSQSLTDPRRAKQSRFASHCAWLPSGVFGPHEGGRTSARGGRRWPPRLWRLWRRWTRPGARAHVTPWQSENLRRSCALGERTPEVRTPRPVLSSVPATSVAGADNMNSCSPGPRCDPSVPAPEPSSIDTTGQARRMVGEEDLPHERFGSARPGQRGADSGVRSTYGYRTIGRRPAANTNRSSFSGRCRRRPDLIRPRRLEARPSRPRTRPSGPGVRRGRPLSVAARQRPPTD